MGWGNTAIGLDMTALCPLCGEAKSMKRNATIQIKKKAWKSKKNEV